MKVRSIVAVLLAGALIGATAGSYPAVGEKKKSNAHKPPYKNGPQGGDEWNYIQRDRKSGTISVYRAFPGISPVVGCEPEPSAGWSMFQEPLRVKKRVKAVTVKFSATFDQYTWVTVGARTMKGKWLGVRKFQGPFDGEHKLTADLFRSPKRGTILAEFGMQLGDACPQVGGGDVEFQSVQVET